MYYQIIVILLCAIVIILINLFFYKRNNYLEELIKINKKLLYVANKYEKYLDESYKRQIITGDCEERLKEYFHFKYINLKKYINSKDIKLLSKLGINIENRLYSQYDYDDIVDIKLFEYYDNDEIIDSENKIFTKPLPKSVTKEEYLTLYEKLDSIKKSFNIVE